MRNQSLRILLSVFAATQFCTPAFSKPVDVFDFGSIEFPNEFEALSVSTTYSLHKASGKYLVTIVIPFVYRHSYLNLSLSLYGKGDVSRLSEVLGTKPKDRYNEYNMADQIKYHRKYYETSSNTTASGLKFSRFLSEWGTDWSSDYLGYFYKLNSSSFQELFIEIYNSWGSLGATGWPSMDQEEARKLLAAQAPEIKDFYGLTDRMAASFVQLKDMPGKPKTPEFIPKPTKGRDGLYLPTIDNLRWRSGPDGGSIVYEFVPLVPLEILEVGPAATIDGKKGNWVRLSAKSRIGWAFDGYLRPLTEEEISARTEL